MSYKVERRLDFESVKVNVINHFVSEVQICKNCRCKVPDVPTGRITRKEWNFWEILTNGFTGLLNFDTMLPPLGSFPCWMIINERRFVEWQWSITGWKFVFSIVEI